MAFKDHFSDRPAEYARYRPGYPSALFDWLASLAPARALAWDVGTGTGQAALGLAAHFERVIATDAAETPLRHAEAHERVVYKVTPAERSGLAEAAVDLITVAQALHWFDFDGFYAEVRRVLKPAGVIAAWTYGLMQVTPEVDALMRRYARDIVGPYWPAERRYVDQSYRNIPFPFEEIEPPAFRMQAEWRLEDLLGYLNTWSATKRYAQARGADPREWVRAELAQAWNGAERRLITWPLGLRVGRLSRAGFREVAS